MEALVMENLLEKPVENLNPYELDSLSSVPLYSQIVRFFLVAISAGELRVGEKLPTEKKICEQFGVSRITARRAVSELEGMGHVERKQGKGTFIIDRHVKVYAKAMDGFGGFAAHSSGISDTKIISKRFGLANEKEASLLKIEVGSPIQELVRCLYLDGMPLMIDKALYCNTKYPGLIDSYKKGESTYEKLEKEFQAIAFTNEKEISYTVARPDEAVILRCNVGDPLYYIEKSVLDENGGVIHHAIGLAVASRVKLTLSYSR